MILTAQDRREIVRRLDERTAFSVADCKATWKPYPGPQTAALESEADELLYGGSAGGGKSALLIGLAATKHLKSVIYRREYPQLRELMDYAVHVAGSSAGLNQNTGIFRLPSGRRIEFAAVQHEKDVTKQQGRARDLIGFDEAANFTRAQYRFLIGWNRSTSPGQRCRVVLASNPPTTVEGRWIIEEFAPWLDETYPYPALPGELRHYTTDEDGNIQWFHEPQTLEDPRDGSTIKTRSRTFIPAKLEDNPALRDTGYRSVLQALPEPLRSQLLYGDFKAGLEDDAWQVIPSAWVKAAMDRWTEDYEDLALDALGVDIARGGKAKTCLAKRRGPWLGRISKHPGQSTPDGQAVLQLILGELLGEKHWEACSVNVDPIGVGAAVLDLCRQYEVKASEEEVPQRLRMQPVDFSKRTDRRDRARLLKFANVRAFAWWNLRDLLNPDYGENIALPPDPELLGDLCAVHWEMRPNGVTLQPKSREEGGSRGKSVEETLGRSPDCGDCAVYAFFPVDVGEYVTKQLKAPTVHERHEKQRFNSARARFFG